MIFIWLYTEHNLTHIIYVIIVTICNKKNDKGMTQDGELVKMMFFVHERTIKMKHKATLLNDQKSLQSRRTLLIMFQHEEQSIDFLAIKILLAVYKLQFSSRRRYSNNVLRR